MFENFDKKKRTVLEKKGIYSDMDLRYFFPFKYYDFSQLAEMKEEYRDHYVALNGVLTKVQKKPGQWCTTLACHVETEWGRLYLNYMGQQYMENILMPMLNCEVYVCGKLTYSKGEGYSSGIWSMMNPVAISTSKNVLTIHKVYSKMRGIGEKWLKDVIKTCLSEEIEETIPDAIIKKEKLLGRSEALRKLHFPYSKKEINYAAYRQIFEDCLYFACSLEKERRKKSKGSQFNLKNMSCVNQIINSLPYQLTVDQKRTLDDILTKMKDGRRVAALVQGDVGCGKSIVAFLSMIAMADSGYQAVIMAPTVVLAKQHYEELSRYAVICGLSVDFIGGKQKAKEKRDIKARIKSGETQLIVGTHSTITDDLEYNNLALVCIDEEHRFGVKQRKTLIEKAQEGVHTISFSATPIPRSIAVSIYGGVEVYEIKTMPANRQPIQTACIKHDATAYRFIDRHIKAGEQAYVICPLIDTEDEENKLQTVKQVAEKYEYYLNHMDGNRKNSTDKDYVTIGVVTGKQSKERTEEELRKFKDGETKVLVATTVVEVGVNVPNATVIVIEDAWMFGLAQLHQLRGRVGRGVKQGSCLLQTDRDTERLDILCHETDGFKIAEADLKMRGAGNLLGEEQSGDNRFLTLAVRKPSIYARAKAYAPQMVDDGSADKLIQEMEKRSEKVFLKVNKMKYFSLHDV